MHEFIPLATIKSIMTYFPVNDKRMAQTKHAWYMLVGVIIRNNVYTPGLVHSRLGFRQGLQLLLRTYHTHTSFHQT